MSKQIERPTDVFLTDEMANLKDSLMQIIQQSPLPFAIRKVVIIQTVNSLVNALDEEIEAQRQKYYQAIAETANTEPQTIEDSEVIMNDN